MGKQEDGDEEQEEGEGDGGGKMGWAWCVAMALPSAVAMFRKDGIVRHGKCVHRGCAGRAVTKARLYRDETARMG